MASRCEGCTPIVLGLRFADPGQVFGLASARGDLLVGTDRGGLCRVAAGPPGSVFVYDPDADAGGAPTPSPSFAGTVTASALVAGSLSAPGDLALSAPHGRVSIDALAPAGAGDIVTRGYLEAAALPLPAPGAAPLVLLASAPFSANATGAAPPISIPAGRLFLPQGAVVWCSTWAAPGRGSDTASVSIGGTAVQLSAPAAAGASFAVSFWDRGVELGATALPVFSGDVAVSVTSRFVRAGAGLRWRAGLAGFLV